MFAFLSDPASGSGSGGIVGNTTNLPSGQISSANEHLTHWAVVAERLASTKLDRAFDLTD